MYNKILIISPSPWPFFASIHLSCFLVGLCMYFKRISGGSFLVLLSFLQILFDVFAWYSEIIKESVFLGLYTKDINHILHFGFLLFVLSEAIIFLTLFLVFIYISVFPSVEIGGLFPPVGISSIPYYGVPLVNTLLLLSGSITITAFVYALRSNHLIQAYFLLFLTFFLNCFFTFLQGLEYLYAPFSLSSGIFGSIFFILTGLHGIHVIIGTILLIIVAFRLFFCHFTNQRLFFPSITSTYLHFVDFIWLFVYTFLYCWI